MTPSEPISNGHRRLGYQPALDGLRGLAVLGVLAYHGGIREARGGFLGVDVFFVLSGYLITALLVHEWREVGRIDLRAFWVRRFRRLLPALIALSVVMAGWLFLIADGAQRSSLRLDIMATLGYVANWRFISSGQSYFEQFLDPSPLRHTWSLAVEEQWYLLWPIVVWGGLRLSRGRLGRLSGVVIVAAVVSAVWTAFLYGAGDISRVYYGTDTRAQELLIGAALALVLAKITISPKMRLSVELIGLASLAALIATMSRVHDANPLLYRGGFLLVALLVAMVILAGVQPHDGFVKVALSWSPLRSLGKISYGLYLWHWPVNILITSDLTGFDSWILWSIRLEASLALAVVSYFVIERPVLQMALPSRLFARSVPSHWSFGVARAFTAATAMAVVAAIVVVLQSSNNSSYSPGGLPSKAAIGTTLSTMLASSPTETAPKVTSPTKTLGSGTPSQSASSPLKVLITGDSVAFTLGFGFSPEAIDPGLSVEVTAILGCGVVPGQPYIDGYPHPENFSYCDTWEQTWHRGMTDTKPEVVVMLLGAWEVMDREVNSQVLEVGSSAYEAYLKAQLTKAFDIVTADDTPVVVLTAPCYRETEARLGGPDSDRNDPNRVAWFNQKLIETAQSYGSLVKTVDFGTYVCPGGEPREQINGVTMRYDGVHFTKEGGAESWRWLAPKVRTFLQEHEDVR